MKTKILEIIDNKIEDVQSCIDYAKGEWEIHYKGKKEGLQELRQELEKMEDETIKIIDKMIEEYQHCPGEEGFYGLGILGELKSRLSTNL